MGFQGHGMQCALQIIESKRENIWEMLPDKRSIYLEFIRWYCRRLPFSTKKDREKSTNNLKKYPKTKFELLYWLGVNGFVKWVFLINNLNFYLNLLNFRLNIHQRMMILQENVGKIA